MVEEKKKDNLLETGFWDITNSKFRFWGKIFWRIHGENLKHVSGYKKKKK